MQTTNPLVNTKSGIGGAHLQGLGGLIYLQPLPNPSPATGEAFLPPKINVDVVWWKAKENFPVATKHHSGTYGATSCRKETYNYAFDFEIVYDLTKVAELSLRQLYGCHAYFYLGSRPNIVVDPSVRYYWCPFFVATNITPALHGKKMTRQFVSGVAMGHQFLIPEMGTPSDPSSTAGAYWSVMKNFNVGPGVIPKSPI